MASKASDWQKVSGFSGVVTLGKEPTFDEVYGSGAAPMIVAHDKAVQRIPSPTRVLFESAFFGPSGGSNGEPAKPIQTPPLDAPVPSMFSRPFVFDEKAAECEYNAKLSDAFATSVEESKALFSEISDAWRIPKTRNQSTKKAIEEMAGKIIGSDPAKPDVTSAPFSDAFELPPFPPDAAQCVGKRSVNVDPLNESQVRELAKDAIFAPLSDEEIRKCVSEANQAHKESGNGEIVLLPTTPPDDTVNTSGNPTGFVVGQWVKCVTGQPGCLKVGYVDQIERISGYGILFLKNCQSSWGYERFKPFEWQVGRTYRTTLEGVTATIASIDSKGDLYGQIHYQTTVPIASYWHANTGTDYSDKRNANLLPLLADEQPDTPPNATQPIRTQADNVNGKLVLIGSDCENGKYIPAKFVRVDDGGNAVNEQRSTPPDAAPTIVDEEHARLLAEAKLIRDIDTVTDFASLVPVAHEMAVSKGWWQDGIDSRSIDEIVANYHAEVSEAWEEYRAGRMATWYAEGSRKPDGFWIEIADLLIRIADAEGANSDISNGDRPHQLRLEHSPRSERVHYINGRKSKFAAFICELNVEVCAECVEHSPVTLCEEFAKSNNVDLYAAVREKLRYNATRPYRHGGKLA